MKPKIRTEEEHRGWLNYLTFLERHLRACERNVERWNAVEYAEPKAFYVGGLAAATAARDAVERHIRTYQKGRIDSAAEPDTVDGPSFVKGVTSG